jgi:signal transduction histidine kinase
LVVFAVVLSLTLVCSNVYASEYTATGSYKNQKIVHVGFFQYDGYHNMDSSGEKSGYGYDFLQMISGYANFRYVYVGYQDTWSDMLDMLRDGRIDMLTYAMKTSTNKKYFDFSKHSIGTSSAMLTTSTKNERFAASDYDPFDGMRVGMVKGTDRKKDLDSYTAANGISYTPVYYANEEDLQTALQKGRKIDAMMTEEMSVLTDEIIIDKFSPRNIYVIVKKGNTSLLGRIDESIRKLDTADPGWMVDLQKKYFHSGYSSNMSMSQSESKYIRDLAKKNKSLKVLFNPERYPLSYYQGGAAKGVLVDTFKQIASRYDLPYQFVKAADIDEYYQLRDDRKADIILDFIESTDEAEVLGYRLTSPYASSNCSVITKKGFTGTPATAAVVNGSETFQAIAAEQNEQVKIINYDSFADCIKAVKTGKADCTYTYSLTAQMYILKDNSDKLKASQLNNNSFQFRMAVNSKTNMTLYAFLNKASHSVTDSQIEEITDSYLVSAKQSYNFLDYMIDNPALMISLIFIILAILIGFIIIQRKNAGKLKDSNEALEEAVEAANNANASKTRFLSQMSHDIRTPLNGIIGMTQIAEENINDPARVEDSIAKISQSSEHLLTLINDILDLSRIESGKVVIAHVPTDIRITVSQCIEVLKSSIIGRDLEITTDVSMSERPYVLTDALRIRQILINIISNAVKFTPDGGKILFKAEGDPDPEDKVLSCRFEIRDTGIGMDEEFQKNIFQTFVQADSGNARTNYTGSGLGMSIVKQYVDMLNGTIEINSKPGEGTAVIVVLPLDIDRNADTAENQDIPVRTYDFSGVNTLLVEDNEINMTIAQFMLEKSGLIVDTAADGLEAVDKFKASDIGYYRCIFMDIMMPNMNGYEATKAIRALDRPDAETVPIIAMSAKAFSEDIAEALANGMNAHVAKPLDAHIIFETLAKFI